MTLAKTSVLQFILPVLWKVCGKFAESPCASRDREKKNAKLADLRGGENWSFPTAPGCQRNCTQDFSVPLLEKHLTCLLHLDDT